MGLIGLALFIILIALLLKGCEKKECGGSAEEIKPPGAREILDQRYAKGEISSEEYQRIRKDIES